MYTNKLDLETINEYVSLKSKPYRKDNLHPLVSKNHSVNESFHDHLSRIELYTRLTYTPIYTVRQTDSCRNYLCITRIHV